MSDTATATPTKTSSVEESATKLLSRFVADDSHEAENAGRALKRALRGTAQRVYLIPDSYTNGLRFVVDELLLDVDRLTGEIAARDRRIEELEAGGGQNKSTTFPWDRYPEVLHRISLMMAEEGETFENIERYVEDETGIIRGKTSQPATQRLKHKSPPPSLVIDVLRGRDETSWLELWKIASIQYGDDWLKRIINYANAWNKFAKPVRKGEAKSVPTRWAKTNPNNFISPEMREKLREQFHNGTLPCSRGARNEILDFVHSKGIHGVARRAMTERGLDQRRFEEILDKGSCFLMTFEDGEERFIHTDFADHYPNDAGAQAAKVNLALSQERKAKKKSSRA
jgi:hypothetical protein